MTSKSSFSSVQLLSRVRLCDPIDCSTPGFPVHHQLSELAQTHVHHIGDAIQPSHLQSFPASGSFPMSQFFTSGDQSIGVSVSASVLPMNIQDWFPLGLTGLSSLQSKSLLQHHSSKTSVLWCSAFFIVQISHPYMTTEKTIALTRWTFLGRVMSLLFNIFLTSWYIVYANYCLPHVVKIPGSEPIKVCCFSYASWSLTDDFFILISIAGIVLHFFSLTFSPSQN